MLLIKASVRGAQGLCLPDGERLSADRLHSAGVRADYPIALTRDMRPHPIVNEYLRHICFLDRKTVWQYAYEIRAFASFLDSKGSSLLTAQRFDVNDYKTSRVDDGKKPISRSTWLQIESALDGLFNWMRAEGFRQTQPVERASSNKKRRMKPRRMKIRHLTREQWATFMLLGVRGKSPTGSDHAGFRGTATRRMRTGCEIALGTGMRLEEFSTLLVPELAATADGQASTFWIENCAKYEKPRRIYLGPMARGGVDAYRRGERLALAQASASGLEKRAADLYIVDMVDAESQVVSGTLNGIRRRDEIRLIRPELRKLMVIDGDHGLEAMALFITRTGRMTSTSTWQKAFTQASMRYRAWTDDQIVLPMPNKVRPHDLRHTFAVTMLDFLDRQGGETATRGVRRSFQRFKAVRKLQEMMGHSDPATTMQYAAYNDNLSQPIEDAWAGWEDPGLDFHHYSKFLEGQQQ